MPQEFPTASMDITEDFHILHSACVYICDSIFKAKTYNWLPNTHTHTSNNYKQKATGHVTSLANGHLTGSDAPFVCEIPTVSSEKKKARIINFNHFIYFIKKKGKIKGNNKKQLKLYFTVKC